MIVSEAMTVEPFVVSPRASVRYVLHVMNEANVRHVPVVEDETLVGIMSDRDMRALLPTLFESFDAPEAVEQALAQPIAQVMSSDVLSVCPEDELGDAIDLLVENQIGAVPVVEPGTKKLVGIVSYVDALRATRELL